MPLQFTIRRALVGMAIAAPGFTVLGFIGRSGSHGRPALAGFGALVASVVSVGLIGCGLAYPFGRPWLVLMARPIVLLAYLYYLHVVGLL